MGAVFCTGRLAQNYVILRYERGVEELALFALALAVLGPFKSSFVFVPQMANVMVRGPHSFRSCFRFLLVLSILFTLPLLLIGWTSLGGAVLAQIYRVTPDRVARLRAYLRYFTPLVLLDGVSGFLVGLLVQATRTGMVTMLRIARITVLVSVLVLGVLMGWPPMPTICLSMLVSSLAHTGLAGLLYSHCRHERRFSGDRAVGQIEIAVFFLPMVVTTILFACSRPIIFRHLIQLDPTGDPGLPDVEAMVSAVSLAFTFNMLFQAAINQFRNLFVTFGKNDPAGVGRFMRRTTVVMSLLMMAAVASPFAVFFLHNLQGADGEVLRMARQALWPLCLAPAVVAWRNYHHGVAMVRRRTAPMMVGGVARNLSVAACGPMLVLLGIYSHVAAAAMLVLAFAAEAAAVALLSARQRRKVGEVSDA